MSLLEALLKETRKRVKQAQKKSAQRLVGLTAEGPVSSVGCWRTGCSSLSKDWSLKFSQVLVSPCQSLYFITSYPSKGVYHLCH